MGIFCVDLNIVNLDDASFDDDNPESIIHARLMAWSNRPKHRKTFKKDISKELMLVA